MKKLLVCMFILIAVLLTSCEVDGKSNQKFTITFNINSMISVAQVSSGKVLTENQIPDTYVSGLLFNGWVTRVDDAEFPFNISTPIYRNYTLFATYSIDVPDGDILVRLFGLDNVLLFQEAIPVNSSYSILYNTNISGYIFIGWFFDSEHTIAYTVSSLLTNTDIYGLWSPGNDPIYNIVTFIGLNNVVFSEVNVLTGQKVTKPTNTYLSGYSFVNWYTSSLFTTVFDFNVPIESDIEIYGKWIEAQTGSNYPYTGNYYNSIDASNLSMVKNLITVTPSSYEQAKTTLAYSDRDPQNSSHVLTVYSRTSVQGAWSSGGTIWNREHVFPNSKCGYQLGSGTASEHDTHNLKPALASENGSRGNASYGAGSGTFGMNGGYFWPGDIDKGDVARIIMYMSLRWDLNPIGSTGSFQSINLMLQWHTEDPVDAFEMQRNDGIYQYQGNRNPFIDHPELAFIKWGSQSSKHPINILSNRGISTYEAINNSLR
jgi:endonuclease I